MAFTPGMDNSVQVAVEGEGVDGFTGQMDRAIDSLMSFRGAVGMAGAALAGFATGALMNAVDAASEFEDAMVEVEKVSDAETAEAMSEGIRDMAETIPMAQEELAGLAADAARFGVEGPENIENFTETVAKMATATDLSANEAGESLARLATLTDTPIDEIENLGAAINSLGNNFATSQSEITDAMLRASASLESLGLNTTEMTAMSAALNEVSESSRRAGSRLRRLAQEMMDPSKTEDLAGALGMTTEEFRAMRDEDPQALMVQMAEAFAEGDEKAEALRGTLSTTSRQAVGGLAQNLDGLEQAMGTSNEQMAEATSLDREAERQKETLTAQVQLLKNAIRNNAIEIGQVFLPYVTDAVKAVREFITSNESLLSALTTQQKAWGLVGTAIGGVALALATFVSGPVGLAVAALGGLAAAWATDFMGMRDITEQALGAITSHFERLSDIVVPRVENTVADIRAAWNENGGEVVAEVREQLERVVSAFRTAYEFIMSRLVEPTLTGLLSVYEGHMGDLVSETLATVSALTDYFETFTQVVGALWDRWGDEITAVVGTAFDVIRVVVVSSLDRLLTGIRVVLALIRGDWTGAWDLMASHVEDTASRIYGLLSSIPMFDPLLESADEGQSKVASFTEFTRSKIGAMANAVRSAFESVRSTVAPIMRFLADTLIIPLIQRVSAVWERHGEALKRETRETWNAIKGVVSAVLGFVVGVIRKGLGVIRAAFDRLLSWLAPYVKQAFEIVKSAVSTALDLLVAATKWAVGVMRTLWDTFGDEILGIVEFAFDAITRVVSTALDGLLTLIRTTLALIRGDWDEAWELVADFAERTLDGLVDFVGEWGGRFLDALTENLTAAFDAGRDLVDDFAEYVENGLSDIASGVGDAMRSAINNSLNLPFNYTIGEVEVSGETVFGGKSISIPALAEGGVVTSPTLAMVGEGGENEAVVPLSKLDQMAGAAGGAASGNEVVVRFEGEGSLVDLVRREARVEVREDQRRRQRRVERLGTRGGGPT